MREKTWHNIGLILELDVSLYLDRKVEPYYGTPIIISTIQQHICSIMAKISAFRLVGAECTSCINYYRANWVREHNHINNQAS